MSVDVDRVSAEATRMDVRPGRALMTVAASAFWAVGFLARKSVYAAGWCWAAIKLGYADGGPPKAKR